MTKTFIARLLLFVYLQFISSDFSMPRNKGIGKKKTKDRLATRVIQVTCHDFGKDRHQRYPHRKYGFVVSAISRTLKPKNTLALTETVTVRMI